MATNCIITVKGRVVAGKKVCQDPRFQAWASAWLSGEGRSARTAKLMAEYLWRCAVRAGQEDAHRQSTGAWSRRDRYLLARDAANEAWDLAAEGRQCPRTTGLG